MTFCTSASHVTSDSASLASPSDASVAAAICPSDAIRASI
jgi:ferredoxin